MDLPSQSQSQDPSDPAQLDGGLPDVCSTPCFIVLDSQAENTEADRGEESVTEARARRLKQLEELTKNSPTKPLLEMEFGEGIQRSGDKEDDKKESTRLMTSVEGIEVKTQSSKNDEASSEEEEEEEEEENEVPSTQEDLFDEEKKSPNEQGDFRTPSTSKDDSHLKSTPSEDVHTTPTSRDASHIIGTPSETLGSLRLSGIVLANETSTSGGSSASINVVYPSPEAYGPAPLIIPSTPTRPDTSNEELIELSDNDDMPRATLPKAPLKRKSTNTSDESEDVYGIPAWQQELNQLQKRKEEEGTQDSWLKDNSGSKQARSLSTSIDSTNPSSELSENIHKSSVELEESLSLQQQQPLMASTTDESSRQSANSRPPSASIVGNGTKDRVSYSAPLLGDTGVRTMSRDTKHSSGSSQKKQASLPGDVAYDVKHPVTKEQPEEPCTTGQATDFEKTSAEMKTQCDDETRLKMNVKRHGDLVPEPDIEIIDDDEEEEEDCNKREDVEAEMGVDPSQDWQLRLSPSQTQTQTQYSVAHRELGITDVMSQRDLSQTKSKAVEEDAHKQKTTQLKGDGKTTVSRQATPWHSTQADDVDDEVSIVIPESEKLGENKEDDGTAKQKLSDPDDGGEKAMKEGSREKLLVSGEGMEDSVFLEGDAQLPDEGRLRLGQLGESDNPSPIAGFHLSVPKDGALLRPLSSMTPHISKKGQWRTDGTPRHSTPIADETEGSSSQREVLSTADKETPKTNIKSSSALVVSAVIEMDSAESSEIPAFNLRSPADCSELLKEVKESPSKKQKSVFSRVVEATKAAKSNTRTKKQTAPADKDPFSLTKPKTKLILGKKRNQQSLPQDDQLQGTTKQASKGKRGKEIAIEEEHGGEREAPVEEDNSAKIPLDYHGDDPRTECPDVEVVEEMTKEEVGILKTRQEETQQYGANDEKEAEVEMEIDTDEEKIEEGTKERMEEVEELPLKGQEVFVSQERGRDPYEFTESQSNKTPTPMKTWGRKEDTVPKETLPSKNLSEVSSTKPTTEQPSTSAAVTLKTKRTPKGSRQNRGAKRKRPQDQETTEEEGDNVENSALNRTRTSPRKKASSTVRKVPKKRGKVLEKRQNQGQTAKVSTEKPPLVTSPSMTQRIVQDPVPVAAERRLQASPASLELRQIPGHSPPTRQPPPWKIVRYKKVNITQRIKEVIEWGEIVETTVLEQVVNEEIIEKLEQDFMTPSPRSKTSSLTSGSLADISSLGSRTSSSIAWSLQKSSSVLSTGIQKSISLSGISEGNSSLDKTISLPGSEKTSPNLSGHEQSLSGRQLTSPGGVVPQQMPSRGTRASPGVLRNQDSSRVSPMVTQRRSFTGGTEHPPGISEQTSRTGRVRSPDISPSALMLSRRMSSKGSKSSSVSLSDAEVRMVPDGKDAEFAKPKRAPSRRVVSRTPEQAEQSTHEQPSNVCMDPPPELNLSGGWNVEQAQQSSEESEGIPCAQPRNEMERISSDETVEKSDGDVGKQTTTTGDSLEEKVDDPGPSTSNQEGPSTRPTRGKRRGKAQIPTPMKQSLDDTIIVQDEEEGDLDLILTEPPQESRQQTSAGHASSTSELTTDSAQAFLVPGVRVFTRWMDGFYYPGTIKKEEKNNRLKIAFDDGDMRSVNSKDIIIKDWLSTGQSVMAESATDGYNYPGIVIGYFRGSNPKDAGYFIETDNGQTTRYPRKKVILSKDQANLLLTSCPSSSTGISDISLENLVAGPRQRSRLRAPDGDGVVRTPSKVLGRSPRHAPSPAVTRSGGKRKATEKQPAESSDVSPRKKAKQLAKSLRTIVTASPDLGKQGIGIRRSPRKQPPSTSTPGSPAMSLASATRGGPPSTPRTMDMLLGPLPSNRKLFKGMAFFLTQGEVKKRGAKVDTSTSESELEDDDDEVPFDKDYARKQIEAGGGVVLKDFDKSQKTQYKLSLIANTYCRTKKYFLALAFNIPCVSHLWIRDCSRTGKLQSHKAYLLPAGESVNGNIMEWKPNRRILSGLKIMVVSSHIEVENTWRSILMVAGCHIVARFPTINELNRGGIPFDCSVMVTDPSCPRHILHRAQQLEIPVVSVEWVMQSLINGVRMPYDSHDKFLWDYKEKLK